MTVRHKIPPEIYFQNIPTRFTVAGGLIFNEKGELLIVKPHYKDYWEIPGGITDNPETVRETALREIKEELGIEVALKGMLCIDFKSAKENIPASIQTIFEVEALTVQQLAAIKIDNDEIVEYGFFPIEAALSRLGEKISNRVAKALQARENNSVFYLENGENPFGKKA